MTIAMAWSIPVFGSHDLRVRLEAFLHTVLLRIHFG
jgi:hypothetical protein